jgi:hypothetical protein
VKRLLPIAVVLVAAGLAALAVNLLLVGYASDRADPVGKLSPRAQLPASGTAGETATTESGTTSPGETATQPAETQPTGTIDDGDDGRGRGRGRNRGRGGDGSSDDD